MGVPQSFPTGVPHPVPTGGTPSSPNGGYPHPAQWGGTHSRLDGGNCCWDWMGIPPVRTGWGYPLPLGMDDTWTGYATSGMPLVVSCRRTFLFNITWLPPAYQRMWGCNVSQSTETDTLLTGPWSLVHGSFWGVPPVLSLVLSEVLSHILYRGPLAKTGVPPPPARTGSQDRGMPHGQERGTPWPLPSPADGCAARVVCLLRSYRRTLLLNINQYST